MRALVGEGQHALAWRLQDAPWDDPGAVRYRWSRVDQTADPPYTNTLEGRARLARIRHPLEATHKQGCDLLMHHQFELWRANRGDQTFDIYVVPPACDCGGRDVEFEQTEAVEVLAWCLRHPPDTDESALQMATEIVEKLKQALR